MERGGGGREVVYLSDDILQSDAATEYCLAGECSLLLKMSSPELGIL